MDYIFLSIRRLIQMLGLNVKTAHVCFKAGVTAHKKEPAFKNELLVYDGRYSLVTNKRRLSPIRQAIRTIIS